MSEPTQLETILVWYSLGLLNTEEVIDQLARYPYKDDVDHTGDIWNIPDGTFHDVEMAFVDGRINAEIYDSVVERLDRYGLDT